MKSFKLHAIRTFLPLKVFAKFHFSSLPLKVEVVNTAEFTSRIRPRLETDLPGSGWPQASPLVNQCLQEQKGDVQKDGENRANSRMQGMAMLGVLLI